MKAVLLVSHGSHSHNLRKEISGLANTIGRRLPDVILEYAFLEIESPSIPEGIDRCITQGATELLVALNFLNAGRHVDEDIPAIVHKARQKYPTVKFSISPPIGQHPQTPDLFIDLINNA